MGFSALKKRSKSSKNVSEMMSKLNQASGSTNSYIDDRYWKLERDKTGNGYAIIRFLDAPDGEDFPFVKMYSHGFKGQGGWYIENSLTTINKQDPVSEANSELWNSGIDSNKEIARNRKRRLQFVSNIYVVKDSDNPANEGKTFLFKYGKSIFDMIQAAGAPEFDDETPVNVFDLFNGSDFKLKARKADGFVKYDKSTFEQPSQWLKDEDAMEKLYNSLYSLDAEVAEDKFKTYDELKSKFLRVTGGSAGKPSFTAESISTPEPVADVSGQKDEIPWDTNSASSTTASAEEDDTMSYFSKLADG
ncbi:MAG TPA: single-stranded DNA-binding protein [Gammaproteobacteria bacterium]|jgi:hypothetical protein|nr:single-stranded DNA-binding protein [Gammaproteobacteria bacterium]